MTDIIERVRQALEKDLAACPEGEIAEWNPDTPGEALSRIGSDEKIVIRGWGMKVEGERLAQAMLPTAIGTIVIDIESEPFFETQGRSISLTSETDRTIAESDPEYALELAWPDEADPLMEILDKLGMEIVPTIQSHGGPGTLSYSRNNMRKR